MIKNTLCAKDDNREIQGLTLFLKGDLQNKGLIRGKAFTNHLLLHGGDGGRRGEKL